MNFWYPTFVVVHHRPNQRYCRDLKMEIEKKYHHYIRLLKNMDHSGAISKINNRLKVLGHGSIYLL